MNEGSVYRGYRFPPDVTACAVWSYHRFTMSLGDIEELLAERGIEASDEAIRQWSVSFGPMFARRITKGQGPRGDRWFLVGDHLMGCVSLNRPRVRCLSDRPKCTETVSLPWGTSIRLGYFRVLRNATVSRSGSAVVLDRHESVAPACCSRGLLEREQ